MMRWTLRPHRLVGPISSAPAGSIVASTIRPLTRRPCSASVPRVGQAGHQDHVARRPRAAAARRHHEVGAEFAGPERACRRAGDIATVSKPQARENCTARWPRPPMPSTATRSCGFGSPARSRRSTRCIRHRASARRSRTRPRPAAARCCPRRPRCTRRGPPCVVMPVITRRGAVHPGLPGERQVEPAESQCPHTALHPGRPTRSPTRREVTPRRARRPRRPPVPGDHRVEAGEVEHAAVIHTSLWHTPQARTGSAPGRGRDSACRSRAAPREPPTAGHGRLICSRRL